MDQFVQRLLTIKEDIEQAVDTLKASEKIVKPSEIKECDAALTRYTIKTALKKLNSICDTYKAKQSKKKGKREKEEVERSTTDNTEDEVTVKIPLDSQSEEEIDPTTADDKEIDSESHSEELLETEVSFTVTRTPKKSESKSPVRKSSRLRKETSDIEETPQPVKRKSKGDHDSDNEEWTPTSQSKFRVTDALSKKRARTDRTEKECPVCSEKFIFESKLIAHISEAHGEDVRPYKCEECDKSFKKPAELKYHEKTHTGTKQYKCDHCEKTFFNKTKKLSHELWHTKPHCCEKCGDRFPLKCHLAKHICKDEKENMENDAEDNEEDVKPFICAQCGKTFKQSFQLKYHMNQHLDVKPYCCNVCNKTFMNARNLRDHSSIHTGEKPYKCDLCDQSFRTRSMQRQHQAIHTRPYRCKYCDASFTKQSLCNQHMINSHGSKNIAEQLENVKANMSLSTSQASNVDPTPPENSANLTVEGGDEAQARDLLPGEERTIIVKIEDHTGGTLSTEEQEKNKNTDSSVEVAEEKSKIANAEAKSTLAESDAVIALDVDGEQVTVFKCAICDQLFPTLPLLEEHEVTHVGVGKNREFSCDRCGKMFSTAQSLTYHQYTHDGIRPFKCVQCDKAFVSKSQLKQHENVHTLPFNCTKCEERFSTKQYLSKHLEKAHDIIDETIEKKRGVPGTFPCTICKEVFNFKSRLMVHMNDHSDYKPFKCGVCSKTFKAKKSLKDHTRVHTGEKPYCCETCGKSFVNQGQLHSHAAIHVKQFSCQYCPKRFALKLQWTQHELLHTHGKTHVCSDCGKAYGSKSMLKNHQEKHKVDRKMYPCPECNALLGSSQALIIHRRLHRGEKPFGCKECGRSFPQRCGLTAHMRTHTGETPFKCDQCDRSFNARNTLKIHKMVHNDQRDHVCEACGRAFLTRSLKERHMATHSSSKNFHCSICGRAYYTIHAMQRHKKKMHGEITPVTASIDIKPIIQRGGSVQDVTLSDTGLTLQQLQCIQRAIGENEQAVKILQAGGDGQEMKIIRTGCEIKDETAQEVKIIPAGLGEQIVSLAVTDSGQASEISYIEGENVQEGVTGVHEVRYIQQNDGTTQAVVDAPENAEMGEVQTIMVEVPYGQELDANSIMTLLQQHQQ